MNEHGDFGSNEDREVHGPGTLIGLDEETCSWSVGGEVCNDAC